MNNALTAAAAAANAAHAEWDALDDQVRALTRLRDEARLRYERLSDLNAAAFLASQPKASIDAVRKRAQRLAAKHGITIEADDTFDSGRYWYVFGPFSDADPCDGDHYASDWYDVLERVQIYVAAQS